MYNKTQQTQWMRLNKKWCPECNSGKGQMRNIKFFTSKLARTCGDCKRRKWKKKLQESPGKLNDKRDAQWAIDIKNRDGNKCLYCGKTTYLNSHHIFSRSNRSVRWELNNGITLCSGHHTLNSDFSAHKTPADFIEWIKELWGEEWYQDLRTQAKGINPYQNEMSVEQENTFLEGTATGGMK